MPPKKALLSAAVYDRVSKDKRRDARSIAEQKAANVTECDENGWAIKEVFADNDRSASRFATKARPDWQRLLDALADGEFNVLVLWEPSRGDRELEMWARLLNTCRREGVLVHITSHHRTYDVRRPRDWRTLAEDGVDSAYESEKVSERIRRGTRSRAAEGRPHGKRLYGYDRVYDSSTGQLIGQKINEAEAAIVRELADKVIEGVTLLGIARALNVRGVPGPRSDHWQAPPIKRLLLNAAYIGYRVHFDAKVHSPEWFPPILDDRTHYLCVSKLTAPERGGQRPSAIRHLLSGLAVCGVCGGPVRIVRPKRPSYCCKRRIPDGERAGHVLRVARRAELYVESLAIAALQDPKMLAAMTPAGEGDKLQRYLDDLDRERAELEPFYRMAEAGELTAEGLARVEAARLPKIKAAERRVKSVRFLPGLNELLDGGPEQVPARWNALEISQKRDYLSGIFAKIEIMPVGAGRKNYTDEESVKVTPRRRSV